MKYTGTMIAVTDMGKSKRFYRDVLGLKITSDTGENVTFNGAVALQTLDTWVQSTRSKYVMTENHSFELYFETDNLDALIIRLKNNDVFFVHEPMIRVWGQRFVRFYDPDRHIIEVGEAVDYVVQRFAAQGMSVEEISERTKLHPDFIRSCLNEN